MRLNGLLSSAVLNSELCLIFIFTSMSAPGINVNPEVARNRIFCSCCGGDLDVDEVVRDKNDRILKPVTPAMK